MSSVPYSRYFIYPVPWYSVLIVAGVCITVFLASREERRRNLPKDTVIDLTLWILPAGILGARLYYVLFSWNQFSDNPISVFRIWEGGLAVYGGIIAGFIALLVFSRKRRLPLLQLCDMIVPGLALAQSLGRWGNWFNMEAFGLPVTDSSLCFFPFAVQIPADGYRWHLATFFYESFWNFLLFLFLMGTRHNLLAREGDVFFFYLFLYAVARLVIEELRMDSLYAVSSVRISQFLSIALCCIILTKYIFLARQHHCLYRLSSYLLLPVAWVASVFVIYYSLCHRGLTAWHTRSIPILLAVYAVWMTVSLLAVHFSIRNREVRNADNES